jgi:hypothetical protein
MELRLSLIQSVLDCYHEEVKCRMSGGSGGCLANSPPHSAEDKELCDILFLGGIWRSLESSNQKPVPNEASEVIQSANELMLALSEILMNLSSLNYDHENCKPFKKYSALEQELRREERWTNVLKPENKQRMERQRKITGL